VGGGGGSFEKEGNQERGNNISASRKKGRQISNKERGNIYGSWVLFEVEEEDMRKGVNTKVKGIMNRKTGRSLSEVGSFSGLWALRG